VTLVEVRCKRCRALLTRVESAPPDSDESTWAGLVYVPLCPPHGGAYGSVAKWVEAQRRLGRPHDRVTTGRYIPWADLRVAVRQARRTKRTQEHLL
jgi:hypothetical protein